MVFAVIIPIFFLLGLGYLSVKLSLLDKIQISSIGAFVIKIALPALFLHSLANKNLSEIWNLEYFFVYTGVTFLLFTTAYFIVKKYFGNNGTESAVLSLGASMSNTGLIGSAVLTMLMGHEAMIYVSLIVIIESVLLVPTVLVLAKMDTQKNISILSAIYNSISMLIKNPLFVSVVLGIGCAILQIKIPYQIDQVLIVIGQTASPLALFAIGGGVVGLTLKYVNLQSVYLVLSSNFIMPLLVFLGLSYLTDVDQEVIYAGTIIAALPMPTIFGILGQTYGLNEKVITPLLMSTVVGFIVSALLITLWWG